MPLLFSALHWASSCCLQHPLLCLLLLLLYLSGRPRGSIPCPWRFPLLGHIPYVVFMGFEEFLAWVVPRHGPLIEVCLGAHSFVLLNSTTAVRTAFLKKSLAIAGRPHSPLAEALDGNYVGLGFTTLNNKTMFQRHFTRRVLKAVMTDERINFQAIVDRHTQKLVADLLKTDGKPVDPKFGIMAMNASVFYELWHGVPGEELLQNEFMTGLALLRNRVLADSFSTLQLITMWPWITAIFKRKLHKLCLYLAEIREYFGSLTKQMEAKWEGPIRNGCDIIFTERMKVSSELMESMGLKQGHLADRIIMDLNFAGLETTFRTLHWGMLYLSLHPDAQQRMFRELQSLGEVSTECYYNHRHSLPFCEAVLQEILRVSIVTPMGLEHTVLEETELLGHKLKAGTVVCPNMFGIARDPAIWEQPHQFLPQRFLDKDGRFNYELARNVIIFSVGKRSCLGEGLARKQLFLHLCHIVSKCEISVSHEDYPDLTRTVMLTVEANPYRVIVRSRQSSC